MTPDFSPIIEVDFPVEEYSVHSRRILAEVYPQAPAQYLDQWVIGKNRLTKELVTVPNGMKGARLRQKTPPNRRPEDFKKTEEIMKSLNAQS